MNGVEIQGQCDAGFGAVADAFAANFAERGELGAGFCLYVAGEEKVNLWGGIARRDTGEVWTDRTLQLVFSTTKGAVALCIAMLVARGQLSYDDTVASHWPEFAAGGKEEYTVAELLSHQAGLIAFDPTLDLDEIVKVTPPVENLAAQRPLWSRGDGHGYHAITFGWLAGELIARVDGRRVNDFLQQEVVGPLGIEFWIGLPESEEPRVASLEVGAAPTDPALIELLGQVFARGAYGYRALTLDGRLRTMPDNDFNTRAVHATEMPGANGITNARSLARMYAAAVGAVDGDESLRLIDEGTMERARRQQVAGPDKTLVLNTRFGAGFWLPDEFVTMIAPGSFGHPGAGGSLGYANPELGIGYGYVMNQMTAAIAGDERTTALDRAVAESLGVV